MIGCLRSVSLYSEESCEFDDSSPGRLAPELGSNGVMEEVGVGPGMGSHDSVRRYSQRKKSDLLLLGCASILAAVGLGSDIFQLGRQQVQIMRDWESGKEK